MIIAYFPNLEENKLDLILTTVTGQFKGIYFPDKLSDHDAISWKNFMPPLKTPRRKVYLY